MTSPNLISPAAPTALQRLLAIMARLRDPESGCAWDVAQTFATIAPYTIEEAYEVADAIVREDMAALKDELGDLLLQVVFHARMAEEAGLFAFADVAEAIAAKMEARHPHVFGAGEADDRPREQRWESLKAKEREARGATSALDGVALALPALMRAEKLQKRAARVGLDWEDTEAPADKVREELVELVGDVHVQPAAGIGPERTGLRNSAIQHPAICQRLAKSRQQLCSECPLRNSGVVSGLVLGAHWLGNNSAANSITSATGTLSTNEYG